MITQELLPCWHLTTVETHAPSSTDASFRLAVLCSLYADEQVFQIVPNLESD